MNFFLGIYPDENSAQNIKKIVGPVGEVFDGFEIPVRWSKPQNYHLTLIYLGDTMSFFKKSLIKYRLKKLNFRRFKLKFNTVKLGISRKYKELIYLDLLEGGDSLRNLFVDVTKLLNLKNERDFLPHLTLGRVSKELTDQEYANICRDLSVVTKKLNIKDIEFYVADLKMVKTQDGEYHIVMNFGNTSNS